MQSAGLLRYRPTGSCRRASCVSGLARSWATTDRAQDAWRARCAMSLGRLREQLPPDLTRSRSSSAVIATDIRAHVQDRVSSGLVEPDATHDGPSTSFGRAHGRRSGSQFDHERGQPTELARCVPSASSTQPVTGWRAFDRRRSAMTLDGQAPDLSDSLGSRSPGCCAFVEGTARHCRHSRRRTGGCNGGVAGDFCSRDGLERQAEPVARPTSRCTTCSSQHPALRPSGVLTAPGRRDPRPSSIRHRARSKCPPSVTIGQVRSRGARATTRGPAAPRRVRAQASCRAFVRNQLIDQVYLPIIGDNLAKQLGSAR